MNSKYIIGIIFLIITACSAPITDEQKKADAVYLEQIKEYTLNPDGSTSYHYYHKMLYNSYLSINRFYGETFVVYNPQYQTLKVNKSETRMADGKVVKSPQNAYNEVLPASAADAPAYNYLREMVITHVGLERGAIVELDYEIQTKNGFMPYFFDKINLCESSPVKEQKIIVKVPKGEKLYYNFINSPVGVNCKQNSNDSHDIYKWESFNLNAYSHEPMQAEGLATYPFLTFSTTDFSTVFNFLKGKLTNTFVPDDASKSLLNDEKKGWDKINLIKNHVAININTYGVSAPFTGYRYRTPEEVWNSNGGTEGEKAELLTAMLKLAGFNAQTVIAGYSHNFNKEVGFPGSFDKYWVKVEFEGETRILSPIDDHSNIPGNRLAIALSDDLLAISFESTQKPTSRLSFQIDFFLTNDVKLSGIGNLAMNSFDSNKGLLVGFSNSAYSSSKISNTKDSAAFSITITNPNLAEKIDGYYVLNLPKIAQGVSSLAIGDLPFERFTSIELPSMFNESYSYTFTLPQGLKIISPLGKSTIGNSLGYCTIERIEKENTITIKRSISLVKAIIPAKNYKEFREIMALWTDKNLNKVLIKLE